ncbi:Rad1-domain-containing protein [Cerioporus squamosus]|nr:Rad1-domain-containing protein [Cerioporus squamosus]
MSDEQPRVLTASVADFRYFAALLRGVNFANRASVLITPDGLTVIVEEARVLLGTAFVFKHVFDEFIYNPEADPPTQDSERSHQERQEGEDTNTAFEIPLNTLMDCLNIFGTAGAMPGSSSKKKKKGGDADDEDAGGGIGGGRKDKGKGRADAAADNSRLDQWFAPAKGTTGMRMSYAGRGHPLTLLVTEEAGGPTAICEITTWDPEPRLDLIFDHDRAAMRIILKSSWLREALSELDSTSEKLTIICNPPPPGNRAVRNAPPCLRLRAVGQFGTTELDYPNDREVIETCECPQTISYTYKFSHISRAMRALQISYKTSLRIDDQGMLSMQFMMLTQKRRGEGQQPAFVQIECLPLEDQ